MAFCVSQCKFAQLMDEYPHKWRVDLRNLVYTKGHIFLELCSCASGVKCEFYLNTVSSFGHTPDYSSPCFSKEVSPPKNRVWCSS